MPTGRVQCEISPMAQNGKKISDTLPRRGRVTEVCKEWLVREDGALAYELQQQEVERHYNSNKSRNAIVREDFPMAVDAQRQAEQEAMAEYQRQAMLLEERDALIARDIALQLEREEEEKRRRLEEQDQRMAKIIHEKEKRPKMRPVADINRVGLPLPPDIDEPLLAVAAKLDQVTSLEDQMRHLRVNESHQGSSDDCSGSSCSWPPPPDMEQMIRAQQEKADEELAKRLQEQEDDLNRTLGMIDRDRLLAIEVQDMELAKMMQAKEKAKAKRARERARAKKLLEEEMNQSTERSEVEEITVQEFGGYRVPNIAMAIDPTYSPRHGSRTGSHQTSAAAGAHLLSHHSPQHTLLHHHGEADFIADDDIPPYMPVQGQRRTSSGGSDKKKKKEKSREDCKQQ